MSLVITMLIVKLVFLAELLVCFRLVFKLKKIGDIGEYWLPMLAGMIFILAMGGIYTFMTYGKEETLKNAVIYTGVILLLAPAIVILRRRLKLCKQEISEQEELLS